MLSIITPVLNGAEFIEDNIRSIEKLNIPFEHIVVDGGSTDATLEIVEKYPHIKVLHQKEKTGMYGAIDMGFKCAEFQYLTWVNADDTILADNYTQAVEEAYKQNYDFIYGDAYYLWQHNSRKTYARANRFGKFFLKRRILPFVQPSSFYKKDLYQSVPLRFDKFKICGDLDLFHRMAQAQTVKLKYIRKPLSVFLKYGQSLGDRSEVAYAKERKHFLPWPAGVSILFYRLSRFI